MDYDGVDGCERPKHEDQEIHHGNSREKEVYTSAERRGISINKSKEKGCRSTGTSDRQKAEQILMQLMSHPDKWDRNTAMHMSSQMPPSGGRKTTITSRVSSVIFKI